MSIANVRNRLALSKQKLQFLQLATPSSASCLALGLVLVLSLWSITHSKLSASKESLRENAFREASSLAKAYADQLLRSAAQLDQVTLNIKYFWQRHPDVLSLEDQYKQGLYNKSGLLHIAIFNANGDLISSTFDSTARLNIAKKPWVQDHKNGNAREFLIIPPEVSPRLGKRVIRFTRRLEKADGTFDGIISVAVEPVYLASFKDQASLGASDFLSVIKVDGTLLAHKMGERIRSLPTVWEEPLKLSESNGVRTIRGERFVDGQTRIVAWEVLSGYPMVAIVGLSEQDIFAPHETMARDYRRFAIAGTCGILLMTLVGIYFFSRSAWRKQLENEVKDTYRLATDGAREGFYMVRPIRNAANQVVDFVVEDCNERGASYYGLTRAQLIGTTFSHFNSGKPLEAVLTIFRSALETGYYEDEFKVSPKSPLKPDWIHRRLVHLGDLLAVTLRDISDVKTHEQALARLANADAVTTLPNRHWMMNYLPTVIEGAKAGNSQVALLFVDLDDFKNINDTLGHAAGDLLLREVALRLKSVVRPNDKVVRLGGDEFNVILEVVDTEEAVANVAERIIKSFADPFLLTDEKGHHIHASIGISMFPRDGDNGETLLKHADIAMYAAKANSKGNYVFYEPYLSEKLMIRLNKEQALRQAIERDEFVLYFQPRVRTSSGELRGLEALVRWVHPDRGLVPPQEFIPIAEETGLIMKLGELVVKKAIAQLAQWKAQGLPVVAVSINVSPRQFNEGKLSTLFRSCMKQHAICPSLLEIEITESCMMGEEAIVTEELAAIEALGVKLSVDDFGTGYSSLSQLQRLDMDVLKVDRAFTAQLDRGREGEVFFMAILSMAHVLGLTVVAEGVETMEQLHILQALSCDEVQGYMISKPVPASDVPKFLKKRFLLPSLQEATVDG